MRAERMKWHVSTSSADAYNSQRLALLIPQGHYVYEVMRENDVVCICFTRRHADLVCSALANSAAAVAQTDV